VREHAGVECRAKRPLRRMASQGLRRLSMPRISRTALPLALVAQLAQARIVGEALSPLPFHSCRQLAGDLTL
jgi:hypothetical protein